MMIHIIQTNTGIDDKGNSMDFQSYMFQYESWDRYKFIMTSDRDTNRRINGTMCGRLKNDKYIIKDIKINDDFHLEVLMHNENFNFDTNVKAYLVTEDSFKHLLIDYNNK